MKTTTLIRSLTLAALLLSSNFALAGKIKIGNAADAQGSWTRASEARVEKVMKVGADWIFQNLDGVNTLMYSSCDVPSKQPYGMFEVLRLEVDYSTLVPCIEAGLTTSQDLEILQTRFPQGLTINGVLVGFRVQGPLIPAPRASGSN